jgi:hypothetical protein
MKKKNNQMHRIFLRFFNVIIFFLLVYCRQVAWADEPNAHGIIGGLGASVGLAGGVIDLMLVLTGMGVLFAGFLQYLNYRKNSLEYPLSRSIVFTVVGSLLLGVSLIPEFPGLGLPNIQEHHSKVVVYVPLPPTHSMHERMNKPFFYYDDEAA